MGALENKHCSQEIVKKGEGVKFIAIWTKSFIHLEGIVSNSHITTVYGMDILYVMATLMGDYTVFYKCLSLVPFST